MPYPLRNGMLQNEALRTRRTDGEAVAPSTFTWLDTSEHDRRRALDVIDLFKQRDTRDELGIGPVRDALADLLTPGTSTIQTRARYLFFIPWTYLDLERLRASSADVARRARERELALIDVLAESADHGGTIGIEARRKLKRLPSAVYWGGLGTFGIRLFPGAQDQYHRGLDRFYREQERASASRQDREGERRDRQNWHPHLPAPPSDHPTGASFALRREEAEYLQDRILQRAPGSLLAFLMDRGRLADPVDFPWEHPLVGELPSRLSNLLEHARCFSEAMHGAALLYNRMLAELLARDEWTTEYQEWIQKWVALVGERAARLAGWDRSEFWKIVRSRGAVVPSSTQAFIESWISLALGMRDAGDVISSRDARNLIEHRERYLKRGRARLVNREQLELWGGAAGTAPLDYRWGTTQTIVTDILRGVAGEGSGARAA